MVWYTLLCGMAGRVKAAPETFRPLFSDSGERKRIVTDSAVPGEIDLGLVINALRAVVPSRVDAFLPRFSSSTPASDLACMAAFCDAVTPFYDYMTTRCGIPAVRLLGDRGDWTLIRSSLEEVSRILGEHDPAYREWAAAKALPVIDRLIAQFDAPDPEFMGGMFQIERCGSGHDSPVAGWIVDLYVDAPEGRYKEVEEFPSHIAKVPFHDIPTGREFELCHGLFSSMRGSDGFYVPEFSSLTNERESAK